MIYKGHMANNQYHGFGNVCSPESNYLGFFEENVKSGLGREIFTNQTIHLGHWRADEMEGYGRQVTEEEVRYCGGLANGRKHGYGEYSIGETLKFTGVFVDDVMDGFGSLEIGDCLYIGTFLKGLKDGIGWERNGDGQSSYYGGWEKGQKSGTGLWTVKAEESCDGYFGEFFEDELDGVVIPQQGNRLLVSKAAVYVQG